MKPLIVLLSVFIVSLLILKMIYGVDDFPRAGRIGMAFMLVFTAMGHFIFTEGMTLMIPSPIPFKREVVYLTAVIEIMAAIGLLIPKFVTTTGWFLIIFLLVIFMANVQASFKYLNYETGNFNGAGPAYLWFRAPVQLLYIVWVYLSAIRF
ncbi:hypothetical protein [Pseudozobellia sp. WGM2]|uniref:DoxX family protein n=1 Tax=Pseudozobellia sp. WGM2 TaxID=2787625 RepID=UPI001ADF37FD|nr:hypothetical protein [Pseudozobellia sp. WGM2]